MAEFCIMRVNLIAQPSLPLTPGRATVQLSLTIRPSCGLPGDFQYPTDSATLLRMLRLKTDLHTSVLERFQGDLHTSSTVKLLGVELSEHLLTEIGYFVD